MKTINFDRYLSSITSPSVVLKVRYLRIIYSDFE